MQRGGEVKGLCYFVFCVSGLPSVVVLVMFIHCFNVGMDGGGGGGGGEMQVAACCGVVWFVCTCSPSSRSIR